MNTTVWTEIIEALSSKNVEVCVEAAERLHKEAGTEDIPNLLALLRTDDFFVREAAAWPLAELAGATLLPELLAAYQRGFDDGHDNDGFTAALLEIPYLHPDRLPHSIASIIAAGTEPALGHAKWLREFCK